MEDIRRIIAEHPFLTGAPEIVADLLARSSRKVVIPAGAIIAREGEPAEKFYLLLRGKASIEAKLPSNEEINVQVVGPGHALSWSWLLPPYQWHFTAKALEEIEALEWDTKELRQLAEENPQFGYEMARRMTGVLLERLRATHEQVTEYFEVGD
ncbi:MAG: cyclic nucleotide-binding domain-containing protein [Verrucomicrobia bacterium]|nr:cyclic nucleotide-binding domain-containing protein [Verrucomicrobiota bacterium]